MTQPTNLIRLVRKIHSVFVLFLQTENIYKNSQVINLLNLLTMIISVCHEPQYWDFSERLFWEPPQAHNNPFGKQLLHTIMKLAFLPGFTVSPEKIIKSSSYSGTQESMINDWIWFGRLYYFSFDFFLFSFINLITFPNSFV